LGGTVSFDGIMLNGITPSWPDFGTIQFTSMDDQFVQADLAGPTEPGTTWTSYTATLNAATFANQGSATLAGVLSNLKSVTLNAEAGNGAVEVIGIDNFQLTAVPEPSTWALMLAGLLVTGCMARKRS